MQVVVDSLLTAYERTKAKNDAQAAERPVILILPGWADSAAGWRDFRTALEDSYDVVVLNLPGFGGSDQPPVAWGLDEYADFVAAFIKKLAVEPYAIIGHSNGGAIAVRGLARGVLSADKLVLLASAGIRNQLRGRKRVLRVLTKAGKLLSYPLPAKVRSGLRQRLYATVGSDMLVAEHMQETFKKVVTDDIQADAARLQLPVLLVYGEDDAATPVQYGRVLRNLIDGSTLETIGQAGHFVHLDKSAEVQALVRKFL